MEITRTIEREKVVKILYDYKNKNYEEIMKFNKILKDLEKKLLVGEKLLNERYNYMCGDLIEKLKNNFPETYLINNPNVNNLITLLEDKNKIYDIKSLYVDQLKRCKSYAKPKFEEIHKNLKNEFDSIKTKENEMFSKCVVIEHEESDIKNCLYNEFTTFKMSLIEDVKEYYEELDKFKKYIYI